MLINKNGRTFKKWGIILNILLHYNKYQKIKGERVMIVKNDDLPKYDKYIDKIGIVEDFEFINFRRPVIIWFDGRKESLCFSFKEFKLIKEMEIFK